MANDPDDESEQGADRSEDPPVTPPSGVPSDVPVAEQKLREEAETPDSRQSSE